MQTMMSTVALLTAALAAGAMGFSIQRGATCTVAAVDELVRRRGATRLLAMLEAALWVAIGLMIARRLQWLGQPPAGFELSRWTVAGAALLGLGAFLNRACVFGAIARLGSGEWAYLATPLGFYLGCLSVQTLFPAPPPQTLAAGSAVLDQPNWLLALLAAGCLWRLVTLLRRPGAGSMAGSSRAGARWSPLTATLVIGLTFLCTLLLAGAWAYTDLLADLARGVTQGQGARVLLSLALLLGAIVGGWSAGLLRASPVPGVDLLRCLGGGMLMGWGSALIPGSNDGMILIGLPLLWAYAWVGVATMCLSIAGAMWLHRAMDYSRGGTASAR